MKEVVEEDIVDSYNHVSVCRMLHSLLHHRLCGGCPSQVYGSHALCELNLRWIMYARVVFEYELQDRLECRRAGTNEADINLEYSGASQSVLQPR